MDPLDAFDNEVKEMVTSNKLSASRVKKITDAAMDNISHDAHLVATLFRVHKAAKSTHKISSLYIIDAIAREAKQRLKKSKDKGKESSATPQDDAPDAPDSSDTRKKGKGTYASFLAKIEPFVDRLVGEVLTKGPPEHKEKVRKVLDIWTKTGTFSSKALKPSYAKLDGNPSETKSPVHEQETNGTQRTTKDAAAVRSTTPPYPPPEPPIRYPPLPAVPAAAPNMPQLPQASTSTAFTPNSSLDTQLATLLALQQHQTAAPAAPIPVPAVTSQPVPSFEASQLALLQQLAAQSSVSAAAPTTTYPTFSSTPPVPPTVSQPPSDPRRAAEPATIEISEAREAPRRASRWSQPNEPRIASPPRDRDRDQGWGARHHDRRSRSPPARSDRRQFDGPDSREGGRNFGRNRYDEDDQDHRPRGGYQNYNRGGRPGQERKIATFMSDDTQDDGYRKKGKELPRDGADLSSFEVNNQGSATINSFESNAASFEGQRSSISQDGPANKNLENVAPFDPSTFNPLDPSSWASFAAMCEKSMGYQPSNQEMCAWIMQSMMGGGGGMMAGMGQGMMGGNMQQAASRKSHNDNAPGMQNHYDNGSAAASYGSGSFNKGRGQAFLDSQGAGSAARQDYGEGEAEMDMTADD